MALMLFLRSVSVTFVIHFAIPPVHCITVIRMKQAPGQFSSRLCGHVNPESTLELECPIHTWFHVLYKAASEDSISNCAEGYPITSKELMSSSNSPPLATDCRGPQTTFAGSRQRCDESIQVHYDLKKSNISFFGVTYECVDSGVQYNMCKPLSKTITSGDLYLASPSFFPSTGDDVDLRNITCHCTVTSDPGGFSARALYLSQRDDWNITCQSCKSKFIHPYEHYPAVNEDLFLATQHNGSHVFQVQFLPFSESGQKNELWLHVTGSSSMHLQCNINEADATPWTTRSTSTKTDLPLSASEVQQKPTSTGMHSSSDNTTSTTPLSASTLTGIHLSLDNFTTTVPTSSKPDTIPEGVLVLFGFLGCVVCVTLLGVAVYWLRRRKKTQMKESSTELRPRGARAAQTPTAGIVESRRASGDYDVLQMPDQTQSPYDILTGDRIQAGWAQSPSSTGGDVGTRVPRQELYRDSMSQPRAVSDGQFHLYTEVLWDSRDTFRVDHDGYMVPRLFPTSSCSTDER